MLFKVHENLFNSEIFALSPSDFVINEFDDEISTLITEYGSKNKANAPKKREKHIHKTIKSFNNTLYEIKYNRGVIRSTLNMSKNSTNWEVELFDKAFKVTKKETVQ